MNNVQNRKKNIVLCTFLLLLTVIPSQIKSPLILWNKTRSVPIGAYMRVRIGAVREGSDYFVSIAPQVLNESRLRKNNELNSRLNLLQENLEDHEIPLIKKISEEDKRYIIEHQALPDSIYVESTNARGIDSKVFGRVKKNYIRGVYVLVRTFCL